ncbi:unnamed protein product [Moneuplotes crassus]|uniref:Uncharacterized protein n=1 Tax=Euplotes crassus TaxID=5936 RepID=A0AAD2CXX9_EUPCR|nr:unnamed protein product [Moneuplotes crassus]
MKVAELEKENFRLQNLLISYRSDKLEIMGKEPVSFIEQYKEYKNGLCNKFIEGEGNQNKRDQNITLLSEFERTITEEIKSHKDFLDATFEALISHPFPALKNKYWGDFDKSPLKDYETIQKFSKLSKYQIPEFKEKHDITPIDEVVASLYPTKKQYSFMKKFISREKEIYNCFKQGVELLLKAKEIFEQTIPCCIMNVEYFMKSKVFDDQKFLDSKYSEYFLISNNAFNDIFKIQVTPKAHTFDLEACPEFGKPSKKLLKRSERTLEITYNHFSLPSL